MIANKFVDEFHSVFFLISIQSIDQLIWTMWKHFSNKCIKSHMHFFIVNHFFHDFNLLFFWLPIFLIVAFDLDLAMMQHWSCSFLEMTSSSFHQNTFLIQCDIFWLFYRNLSIWINFSKYVFMIRKIGKFIFFLILKNSLTNIFLFSYWSKKFMSIIS